MQDQLRNAQQIQAANGAFAAILGDKSVMTRGDAHLGGDSGAVQDRLKNVEQIQASESAFAANGCVVTWGCCSAWRRQQCCYGPLQRMCGPTLSSHPNTRAAGCDDSVGPQMRCNHIAEVGELHQKRPERLGSIRTIEAPSTFIVSLIVGLEDPF